MHLDPLLAIKTAGLKTDITGSPIYLNTAAPVLDDQSIYLTAKSPCVTILNMVMYRGIRIFPEYQVSGERALVSKKPIFKELT